MGRYYKEGMLFNCDINKSIDYYDESFKLGHIDALNAKG
jgi:hypothetical protein